MKRIAFVDYLRVFACFLVLIVHASENYYGVAGDANLAGPQSFLENETDRLWVSVYDGFSRMAVPLFMIVSAFLLAPMRREQTMWEFYAKRLKRVVPPMAFFMLLYIFMPLLWGATDMSLAMTDFKRFLLNFPGMAGHLWFMYPLIGVYLFIPIISPWLREASEKEERFFVILFLISTCIPYLNRWFGEVWGQCFWNEYHMLWNFSGYVGYLVLAHYLKTHLDWSRAKRLSIGSLLLAVGAFITIYSFYVQAVPGVSHSTPIIELGWAFCTINCVMLTTGAFLLFSSINREKAPAYITELSQKSFGIYLVHLLWMPLWVSIFKFDMALPTVAAIPVIAVATFVSCYVTIKLASYIPGSKWLVG